MCFYSLNLMQKELCLTRLKLLCYLDRLFVYEKILNSTRNNEYDAEKFSKLRSQPILDVAIEYARVSLLSFCNSVIKLIQSFLSNMIGWKFKCG